MRVLLICQFAASSKLLVQRMTEEAQKSGEEAHVRSEAIADLDAIDFSGYDLVLLAPQARHYLKKVRSRTDRPVESIDMRAYGLADGRAALEQAKKILEQTG